VKGSLNICAVMLGGDKTNGDIQIHKQGFERCGNMKELN
jgi:hypothetical protein